MAILPSVQAAMESDLPEILALTHRAYARNVELSFRYTGASEPMESLRQSWQRERVYKLVFRQRVVGSIRLINLPEGCLEVKRLCAEPDFQRQASANGYCGSLRQRPGREDARACVSTQRSPSAHLSIGTNVRDTSSLERFGSLK